MSTDGWVDPLLAAFAEQSCPVPLCSIFMYVQHSYCSSGSAAFPPARQQNPNVYEQATPCGREMQRSCVHVDRCGANNSGHGLHHLECFFDCRVVSASCRGPDFVYIKCRSMQWVRQEAVLPMELGGCFHPRCCVSPRGARRKTFLTNASLSISAVWLI